jgi:site-specific DNA recombinase
VPQTTSTEPTASGLPSLYLPPISLLPAEILLENSDAAVSYARFSTLNQKELSIERQEEDNDAYGKRHGLTIVRRYADRGKSGTTIDERDDLLRLLRDGKAGLFTHVIVESLDRLARKLSVAVEIFEELANEGITIHDADENRSLSIYDIGQKGAASQAARDLLVKRAKNGIRRNAAKGTFGIAGCLGYTREWDAEKKELVWKVNPTEAAIIVEAFALFADGVSAGRIADLFNARPLNERGFSCWTRATLVGNRLLGTGILRRLRYLGKRVHGRVQLVKEKGKFKLKPHKLSNWVVGDLDPSLQIVDQELFDRVQQVLNERADAAAAGRPAYPRYTAKHTPLRGLIICAHCGGGMTPTQKRNDGKPRLLCNKARNKHGCTNQHSYALEAVEDEIHKLLAANLGTPESVIPYVDEYNKDSNRRTDGAETKHKDYLRDRETLIKRMDRLRDDEEQKRYPEDYLAGKRVALNTEYAILEKSIAEQVVLVREASTRVDPLNRSEEHRKLLKSIAGIFSDKFDGNSETGTVVVANLRKFIHSVTLTIDKDGCTVMLMCRIVDSVSNAESNLAYFESRLKRNTGAWSVSVREVRRVDELAQSGELGTTDAEWEQIAHLVPDSVARSKRGGVAVEKRKIVDAALLHLKEGVPLLHMPAVFGPKDAVFSGLKRLSESGGWDAVADALHRISPERMPNVHSQMFATDRTRPSSTLKGLPLIRAQHGVAASAGKHAPSDEIWNKVRKLIPEQVLQINRMPASISPRTFLHAFLYVYCENIPLTHIPLMFGTERHFNHAMTRFAFHGYLDQVVQILHDCSPSPLEGADLRRLDRFPRSKKEVPIWRMALPKSSDMLGVPDHYPNDKVWHSVQHLFPAEIVVFNGKTAIANPRLLCHAILYRVREKISFNAMPAYFGEPSLVQNCANKFVFHHLWDEFCRILRAKTPEVLDGADLKVFDRIRRARLYKYRNLVAAESEPVPAHQPSDDDFAMIEDLIPWQVLTIRGGPAIMEPKKFFHGLVFMLKERIQFGGLPPYFGPNNDFRTAARRFVAHHYWDTMKARVIHFEPAWAHDADLTIFDWMKRSANPEPGFRSPKRRAGVGKS